MAIAPRVKWYLESRGVEYELLAHPHTISSQETVEAAHVPGERMAKSVVLQDERGYLIAVLPATHRIALRELAEQLERHLELASEQELGRIFQDCEVGAVPPLGGAYGIPTIVDDALMNAPDIYFEAGDHEDLVHLRGVEFLSLLRGAQHGRFSRHG